MTFDEVLDQVRELLQQRGRVTYRALKRRFELDDEYVEDLKGELIKAEGVAADEDGEVLVWTGSATQGEPAKSPASANARPKTLDTIATEGERRQLTVMFCDLVGSTALSEHLDPEELREVVRTYQETCTGVIRQYEGHIAQHLGDGLLVYFGYPTAHEDDAQRAVRTSLELLAGLPSLNASLKPTLRAYLPHPIQVRIGIHTGLVVIGEIGSTGKREILALGETPNLAARLQGLAEPDSVVVSAATQRLVHGLFEYQDLGPQDLKGLSTPVPVYRVVGESAVRSRFDAAVGAGLTPLVGRELEVGLLQEQWQQAKGGAGQVVLLSGEPGIGKSRLVQELKEQLAHEGVTRIEFHCSPYHQNSALYPIIEHLQRLLQFAREEAPASKLEKLQRTLSPYRFPQADTVPLVAALLSLPHPEGYPPLTVSPQKQKEKTQAALVAWLVEEAEQRPVYTIWEDLHWADPSTLEVLTLFVDQVPKTRLLALLTCRPEFTPPCGNRSHLSQLTLSRLGHQQVEAMIKRVTGGKALPSEVVQQILANTDGVPLFVEELTKTVLESGLLTVAHDHYELSGPLPPLAIPSTLQDSLMARLDRLAPVKEIAQMGAVLGREFSYELLHAVSSVDEATLQHGLRQLVEAELVYQRGLVPQAHYLFKHALVRDTAYQSLLKSRRQQLHQQVAQVLEEHFSQTIETQPELVAHHYTEANLIAQAIPYWQRAGQRATERSADVEAIAHLSKGLELLKLLPDTPERARQELTLQIALGAPLRATRGFGAPEVGRAYARARELCQLRGETSQLFPILRGLWEFYQIRAEHQTARELAEQLLALAERQSDPGLRLLAHNVLSDTLLTLGEFRAARDHAERAEPLYDVRHHRSHAFLYGYDSGQHCLSYAAWALWFLGYPEQALKKIHAALRLAEDVSHPFSYATALQIASRVHQLRRDEPACQESAEATIVLCTEQGFAFFLAGGALWRGWALVQQGQGEEGIAQIRQGMTARRATGAEFFRPLYLALLAEAHEKMGSIAEGLNVLAEALALVDKTGERHYEAELYRLKGELLRAQEGHQGKTAEVEQCFGKALAVARHQQAKSLELRAAMSLSRLWQKQGKAKEAHEMLAEIYHWFTEGFDTADLKDAKVLLEELS